MYTRITWGLTQYHLLHFGWGLTFSISDELPGVVLLLVQGTHLEEQGSLDNHVISLTLFILGVPYFVCLKWSLTRYHEWAL